MNKYLYDDPTTKLDRRCLKKNATDTEQANSNMMLIMIGVSGN